jgi:hypothetical protein
MANPRYSKTRIVGCPHEPKTWVPGRSAWVCPACMSAVCSACKAKYVVLDAVDVPAPPAAERPEAKPAEAAAADKPLAAAPDNAAAQTGEAPAAPPPPPAPILGENGEAPPWWFYACKCPAILSREVLLPPRLWLVAPMPIDEKIEPPPTFDGAAPLAKFVPASGELDVMKLLPRTIGGIIEFLEGIDRMALFHLEGGRNAEARNFLEMGWELRKIRDQNEAVRKAEETFAQAAAKRKKTLDLFDQPGLANGSPLMKKRMGDMLVLASEEEYRGGGAPVRAAEADGNGWIYAGVALFAAVGLAALVLMR